MSADFPWGIVVCGEPRGAWRMSALFLLQFSSLHKGNIATKYLKLKYYERKSNFILVANKYRVVPYVFMF